jgi:tetratricopeptide (TPR) repeat protein
LQSEAAQEAIQDFTDAIALDPNLAEAYHQRARARVAAGDSQGAIADIEQTLRHQPRDFAALRTLAVIAESRQDWKGAYAAWMKLLEIDPMTPDGEDKLKDLRRRALGDET